MGKSYLRTSISSRPGKLWRIVFVKDWCDPLAFPISTVNKSADWWNTAQSSLSPIKYMFFILLYFMGFWISNAEFQSYWHDVISGWSSRLFEPKEVDWTLPPARYDCHVLWFTGPPGISKRRLRTSSHSGSESYRTKWKVRENSGADSSPLLGLWKF